MGKAWHRIRYTSDAYDTDPGHGRFACCGYCGFLVASARIPRHCPCEEHIVYCDQTCQARDWLRHRQGCSLRYRRAVVAAALAVLPVAVIRLVYTFVKV